MNYYRLTWLGLRIACISGALWLAIRHLRPKPLPKQGGRDLNQSVGVLGVYIDDLDRFILSIATSRWDNALLARGRLFRAKNGSVDVEAWDSPSKQSAVGLWNAIRREAQDHTVTQALEALFHFAKSTLQLDNSQFPMYSSLILPFDLSYAQMERALSLSTSAGQFKKTFGVHFHDLIRPLEGPCKPEYGNPPSLVFNPDGSSFILFHSDKGCLHIRSDNKGPSTDPFALISSYTNVTLEDIVSIDFPLLKEDTPIPNPHVTPPIRTLSLDTIVQRAPIVAATTAVQSLTGKMSRSMEDDLQAFVRWHIPLNRDPVLVSLPSSPTSTLADPHRFLDHWEKASHAKFTTSPGQTSIDLEFYTVQRFGESWPPVPGSSNLFAGVHLDGLSEEGGSEVLLWYDGFDVQVVDTATGRRSRAFIGPGRFDEVRWESHRPNSFA